MFTPFLFLIFCSFQSIIFAVSYNDTLARAYLYPMAVTAFSPVPEKCIHDTFSNGEVSCLINGIFRIIQKSNLQKKIFLSEHQRDFTAHIKGGIYINRMNNSC